jgi:hypothetical protein
MTENTVNTTALKTRILAAEYMYARSAQWDHDKEGFINWSLANTGDLLVPAGA